VPGTPHGCEHVGVSDDDFPVWPPEWVEDQRLAAEEIIADVGPISFVSALRGDDKVLLSVRWPGGRRYMMIDPVGQEEPQAFRVGERSDDPEVSRAIEGVWSQALEQAKKLMDGEIRLGAPPEADEQGTGRRRWRRGQG